MMALADVFDALVSRRSYKEPLVYHEARQVILDGRGQHFDPVMVDAFIRTEDQWVEVLDRYAEVNEDRESFLVEVRKKG